MGVTMTGEVGAIIGMASAVIIAIVATVATDPSAVGDVATGAGGVAGAGMAMYLLHQILQRADKLVENTSQCHRLLEEISHQRTELERARQDRADTAAAAQVYRETVRRAHGVAPLPEGSERDAVAAAARQLDDRLGA